MSRRILFDTNVIIDVLTNREPFVEASQAVWRMHDEGEIDGYLSAVSLTNLFYIVRKSSNQADAWTGVNTCLQAFTICEVNQTILKYAAMLGGKDFEDNVQMASASAYQLDFIVTRDEQGFVGSSVPALTPQELMAQIKVEKEG
jgi:predicted nucleic acid-binding protein